MTGLASVDAHSERGVRNSQPEGIGRVASVKLGAAWNNLGRNVVFADARCRPIAVFDESVFDDDEPSQYDLDVHAVLDLPGTGTVLTLNHYGMLRGFDITGTPPGRDGVRKAQPAWTLTFAADVERAVVVGDRLVGTRPRSEGATGLVVSEPLHPPRTDAQLDLHVQLETEGELTALASLPGDRIAVGGPGRIALASLPPGATARKVWGVEVAFRPACITWDGTLLWAAGSEAPAGQVDDYDWEAMRGGGWVALDPADGTVTVAGDVPDDVAWGTGGVPFAVLAGAICLAGRRGEVYVINPRDGTTRQTTAFADRSLGIAHLAAIGDQVLYGYNRGGYRLHAVPGASLGSLIARTT